MNKGLAAIGVALLLLGAGCGGGGVATSAASDGEKAEVQAAVNGLVESGSSDIDAYGSVQVYVTQPIEDFVADGVAGYFEEVSPEIDWSTSVWSNNNNTVTLTSKDGVTLGTWIKKDIPNVWTTQTAWKATSAFWFE